ncbi:MAG: hypothetical protein QOE58_1401 [Actinomycetota bacterium]|jgi:hypothetical protein|nr:hypothetical protein [Actinomycetota bacterium]
MMPSPADLRAHTKRAAGSGVAAPEGVQLKSR